MSETLLRWKAHGLADVNTDYEIQTDLATPNTYVALVTQNSTAPYAPVYTTLAADMAAGATSLTLTDATGFVDGDAIKIDGETMEVDDLTDNTFATVLTGQDNTVKQAHTAGTLVFKMHEFYSHTGITLTAGRYVLRYRVLAVFGSVKLPAAEAVAVFPTKPLTNDKICIYGTEDDLTGSPYAGLTVTMAISIGTSFNPRTGETINAKSIQTTTDASGYWQLITHRDVARAGGGVITVTVGEVSYTLTNIPDKDTVCYLECL